MDSKILFVEDNDDIRRLLAKRLRRRGFEIVEAENGEVGVALALSEKPDLVLMDMAMPKVDGIEATRQLRANPETATLPILALTAFADDGKREEAARVGFSDYVTKPIQFQGLLAKIQEWLETGS